MDERYRAGLATETERLDAEDDRALADIERAAAVARLRLAEVELAYALER